MFSIPAAWWLSDVSWLQGTWFTGGPWEEFFGAEKALPLRLLWVLTVVSGVKYFADNRAFVSQMR